MSTQAPAVSTPLPVGSSIVPGSLRAEMDKRRGNGEGFTIREAVAIGVPLCMHLAELHSRGKTFFVYPSVIRLSGHDLEIIEERAHAAPTLPRDRACLAPEERKGTAEDAEADLQKALGGDPKK